MGIVVSRDGNNRVYELRSNFTTAGLLIDWREYVYKSWFLCLAALPEGWRAAKQRNHDL